MAECKGSTDNGMRRSPTPCMNPAGDDGFCGVHRPENIEARKEQKADREEEKRKLRSQAVSRICDQLRPETQARMRNKVHILISVTSEEAVQQLLDAHAVH